MLKQPFLLAAIFILPVLLGSCEKEQTQKPIDVENLQELYNKNQTKISIEQGVAGTVVLKEGNCMPMIGPYEGDNPCRNYSLKRIIQIYEPTTPEDVEGSGPSFEKIHTNLIAETQSDKDGFFEVELNTGLYSLFIIEKGDFYRNRWSNSYIGPVSVKKDSITIENPVIDYAVY